MGFEYMKVYQAAVLLDGLVLQLVAGIGRGFADDVNQLLRAAGSIVFNIAEAYGSGQVGQKRYHLGLARGSADEVRAQLRRLERRGAVSAKQIERPCALTGAIAKMLTSWIATLS